MSAAIVVRLKKLKDKLAAEVATAPHSMKVTSWIEKLPGWTSWNDCSAHRRGKIPNRRRLVSRLGDMVPKLRAAITETVTQTVTQTNTETNTEKIAETHGGVSSDSGQQATVSFVAEMASGMKAAALRQSTAAVNHFAMDDGGDDRQSANGRNGRILGQMKLNEVRRRPNL